jgi:predicted RNase H-like nuclease (RuvC/YqgF family)
MHINQLYDEIDNLISELDKCGDTYCGNIITAASMKEEGFKFLKNVKKKCRSEKTPKTDKEYKQQQKKYNKCFTKYKKSSSYNKKLTQRKKCEDKNCSIYQKKIEQLLSKVRKDIQKHSNNNMD